MKTKEQIESLTKQLAEQRHYNDAAFNKNTALVAALKECRAKQEQLAAENASLKAKIEELEPKAAFVDLAAKRLGNAQKIVRQLHKLSMLHANGVKPSASNLDKINLLVRSLLEEEDRLVEDSKKQGGLCGTV